MKYDNWINAKYKELETVSLNIKKQMIQGIDATPKCLSSPL